MLFQYERDSEYSCDLIDLFRLEMCLSVPNPIATNPIHHLKSAKCARPPLPSPAAAAATLPLDSNPAYPPPASPSTRAFFLRASPTPAKNPVHSTYVVEIAQQGRRCTRDHAYVCDHIPEEIATARPITKSRPGSITPGSESGSPS